MCLCAAPRGTGKLTGNAHFALTGKPVPRSRDA